MKEDGSSKVDATLYRSLVGKLLYLTATRPDIMFVASLLSRFMHNPSQIHIGVGVFSWCSKKQQTVVQSSAEAEEAIEDGEVQLEFYGTNEQLADIFTKALPREKF
ncbi:hypothetical protein Tco_1250800 [Tanacetum coccineum]